MSRPVDPPWYTRKVEVTLYALAAITYVGLGMFHKFLLNWIIGPVWLVAWVWLVPAVVDRFRRGTPG
jgi:ACR3 family arsenite efflux pump ArsB